MGWKKSKCWFFVFKVCEVRSSCRFFSEGFPPKRPTQDNRIVIAQKKVNSENMVKIIESYTSNEWIVCHVSYISSELLEINKKIFERPKLHKH